MRTRARTDSNHAEIVRALRAAGCLVQSLAAVGKGVPDLLVCSPQRDLFLLEVKGEKGRLTSDQADWWGDGWVECLSVKIVRSPIEALRAVGIQVREQA